MTDFTLHTDETAPEASLALLKESQKSFGMIPNCLLYTSPSPRDS